MSSETQGWGVCVPTEYGPMVAVRDLRDPELDMAIPLAPLIWGPDAKHLAEIVCDAMNAPLQEPFWTVEPVTITAGVPEVA